MVTASMSKIWCEKKKECEKKICSSRCYKNTKPIHVCSQPQPWNRQKNREQKSHSTWYGGLAVRENKKPDTHTHARNAISDLTGCYIATIVKYLILVLAIFICKTIENQIKLSGQLHKHRIWFVIQSWFRTSKTRKNEPATPKRV